MQLFEKQSPDQERILRMATRNVAHFLQLPGCGALPPNEKTLWGKTAKIMYRTIIPRPRWILGRIVDQVRGMMMDPVGIILVSYIITKLLCMLATDWDIVIPILLVEIY
jgi:hypothetical protein